MITPMNGKTATMTSIRPLVRAAGAPLTTLMCALALAAPLMARAQSNGPVTGTMMQETPEQRARIEAAARQLQAEQAARQQAEQNAARQQALQAQQAQAQARQDSARTVVQPAPAVTTVTAQGADAPRAAIPVGVSAAPKASAPMPPVPTFPGRVKNGDVSGAVVRMQAEGRYAAPARPTLGATANATYQRYLDSFSHPIPEFYQTTSQPRGQGSGQQ